MQNDLDLFAIVVAEAFRLFLINRIKHQYNLNENFPISCYNGKEAGRVSFNPNPHPLHPYPHLTRTHPPSQPTIHTPKLGRALSEQFIPG